MLPEPEFIDPPGKRVTGADIVQHGNRTLHDPDGCPVCIELGVGHLHGPFTPTEWTKAREREVEAQAARRVFARPRPVELKKGRWKD